MTSRSLIKTGSSDICQTISCLIWFLNGNDIIYVCLSEILNCQSISDCIQSQRSTCLCFVECYLRYLKNVKLIIPLLV